MKRKPSAGWASIVQGKQAISTIKGKKKSRKESALWVMWMASRKHSVDKLVTSLVKGREVDTA